MVAPRLELDSRFSEAFASFDGKGRMAVASVHRRRQWPRQSERQYRLQGHARRTPAARFDLSAQRARLATIFADRTRLDGQISAAGRQRAAVAWSPIMAPTAPACAGPLLAGLTGPLASARRRRSGRSRRRSPPRSAARPAISTPPAQLRPGQFPRRRRRCGSRPPMRAGRAGRGCASPAATASLIIGRRAGSASTATFPWAAAACRGAELALGQPRNGGPMSGEARIAPYAAGGARLALAPVRFAAARDGSTEVSTIALLDGPFSGGRVRGLRIPINGRIGGRRAASPSAAAASRRASASLQAGALRLGATRLPVCPIGPAILYQRAGGTLGRRRRGAQPAPRRPPRPVAVPAHCRHGADDRQRPLRA